eukprot:CAMPEP_0177658450 /NCGR_PEP_ID=MMETSP0447-20121125/16810_1 /TAXON_ID=0 /ORGANISM="Stygamoeba regulata, Strain BSH-02190019" /LENGTH=600 /DNA_ID=CAMNT_0019163043 /DNA_START=46 /DNA_END=1848 /DNA_ORIENTATION=-
MSGTLKNLYSPVPSTARATPVLMGGDPKGKNVLYSCGSNIIIRNLDDPLVSDMYCEHAHTATVARYAPSGFYIASGDVAGNVRIWDTTNKEHILKIELPVLGGTVKDLCWSEDSKRIVAVGDGKEKFGVPFFFDTGASVGEISGHSKQINSVDMKPNRPYRVVTGSEDNSVNWFEGPPFKFKKSIKDHSRFVNCVRFNPQGSLFCSVAQDKKAMLYDGKTADAVSELKEGAHTGGIMCCSWSADGTKLLTASADKTAKLWDVGTQQCVTTFTFGNEVDDQQLGCLWQGNHMVTLSLSGDLNYLDPNSPAKPSRVVKGHNKFITSFAFDRRSNSCFTGSYDSVVVKWNMDSGENWPMKGKGHSNQVTRAHISGDNLVTIGMDDAVRITPLDSCQYSAGHISVDSPPQDLAVSRSDPGLIVCVTLKSIFVIRNGAVASSTALTNPRAVAISNDNSTVAVGTDDNHIILYTLSGSSLTEKGRYEGHRGGLVALAYSHDGTKLASCDKNRELLVWNTSTGEKLVSGWVFHNARVNCVDWNEDGVHLVTGSLDQHLIVWNISEPGQRIVIKGAHQGGVNGARWINQNTIASIGQDCSMRTWTVTF